MTRAELPDISAPLEILSDDLAPKAPRAAQRAAPGAPRRRRAARPPRAAAPRPRRGREPRATARKVFEAKFREPNPRLPFYITLGALGVVRGRHRRATSGTSCARRYPLVNANPPRQRAARPQRRPAPQPVAPARGRAARRVGAIPGLPQARRRRPRPAGAPRRPRRARHRRADARRAAPADHRRRAARSPRRQPPPAPAAESRSWRASRARAAGASAGRRRLRRLPGRRPRTARAEYEQALREEPGNRDALLGMAAVDDAQRPLRSGRGGLPAPAAGRSARRARAGRAARAAQRAPRPARRREPRQAHARAGPGAHVLQLHARQPARAAGPLGRGAAGVFQGVRRATRRTPISPTTWR